jgi:glycine betaine/proline transport system permease protein
MLAFPEFINIPLAEYIDQAMKWLLNNWGGFFDAVGEGLLWFLLKLEQFFTWLPWPVVLIATALGVYFLMGRRIWLALLMPGLLVIIGGFGYWELSMMTLSLVTGAVFLSLALGIPIGIAMSGSDRLEAIIKPILDAMQTLPSFVYLIPVLMFFGLGKVPAMFATIVYSMPPIIRLTNVGIREVPHETVEAAQAFGSTGWQVLTKVQLPLARPTIVVGINQTTMMALAMVVVASMIGAKGLGMEVLLAINRIEVGRGFEAGLSIVILAIIIDRLTYAMATREKG